MTAISANYYHYHTPFGALTIRGNTSGVTHICLGKEELTGRRQPSEITNHAANELSQYFAHKRTSFSFALEPTGTPFQQKVWDEAQKISFGQTRNLQELAQILGIPDAYRSVAVALNQNPLKVVIPDHRILTLKGNPIGSGHEAQLRGALLRFETQLLQ